MSAQHTPGPWEAEMFPTTQGYPIRGGTMPLRKGDRVLAVAMDQGSAPAGESRANSYLIAAAPDLFAALEGLLNITGDMHNEDFDEFKAAEAALARARGDQP